MEIVGESLEAEIIRIRGVLEKDRVAGGEEELELKKLLRKEGRRKGKAFKNMRY